MIEYITSLGFVAILGWVATAVLMLAWAFKVGSRTFLALCLLSNVLWVWFAFLGENTASLIFINAWMFFRGLWDLKNTITLSKEEEEIIDSMVDEHEKSRIGF